MRVTILGSGGQIGAYLTEYLRKKDYEVLEFDITNGEHQDMTHIPNTYLRNAIMNSDFVFFLAFDVGGSHYLKKYQHTFKFINNNTRLMVNVFGYLEQYDKPFVFASSQMSNMSYSPYGVMKRVGELYTKSLGGLKLFLESFDFFSKTDSNIFVLYSEVEFYKDLNNQFYENPKVKFYKTTNKRYLHPFLNYFLSTENLVHIYLH